MEKVTDYEGVNLWGGWHVVLPHALHERNQDGSWSAWGADWTMDITIIETSGDSQGNAIRPEHFLEQRPSQEKISGQGWIGSRELSRDSDNGRPVFRLTTILCAPYSIMNCCLSYFDEVQVEFADSLVEGIAHDAAV